MQRDEFFTQAASFLSDKTGFPVDAFLPGTELLQAGLVDSLAFMQLIDFVESIIGGRVDSNKFSLERFSTFEKIHDNFIATVQVGGRP